MKSFSRIAEILSVFRPAEPVMRIDDVLQRADVPQSTGYKLIGDLLAEGLVCRKGRGKIALGPSAQALFFAPLKANMAVRGVDEAANPGPVRMTFAPRKSRLEPELLEMVVTKEFRREPPFVIAFANASRSHPWRLALERSLTAAALRQSKFVSDFVVYDANNDPAQQARHLSELEDNGVDLCIFSAASDQDPALREELMLLAKRGFPVVGVDRMCGDLEDVVSFVTASDEMVGRVSALWLAEYIGGRGRILMLCGLEQASPCAIRLRAANQVFAMFPEIEIVATEFTDWLADKGYALMRSRLDAGWVPDGVWCDSGLQGIGSLNAFRDSGFPKGTIPPHTGGEMNLMYKLAATEKVPLCGLDYPPAMGAISFQVALDTLSGRDVPRMVECNLEIVVTRGHETKSVRADTLAERKVDWNISDSHVHAAGRVHGRIPAQKHAGLS